jgi:hypothetical protein
MDICLNLRELVLPRFFLSQKRITRLGIGACLLSLGVLLWLPTWAQFRKPASEPALTQPEVLKGPLDRTTPRRTVLPKPDEKPIGRVAAAKSE